jgi:hypothetical protein
VASGREGLGMDVTEAISPRSGTARLRRRVGGALERHVAVPHRLIPVAAFLLGAALSAVVLVGVWRHAASSSDRAQAARASSDRRLRETRAGLRETRADVVRLERALASQRALLARARSVGSAASARLASLDRRDRAVAAALPGRIATVNETAATLARHAAALTSALASLESYLAANGSSVDPGFLAAQVHYLSGVSRSGESGAAQLKTELDDVAGAAAPLAK